MTVSRAVMQLTRAAWKPLDPRLVARELRSSMKLLRLRLTAQTLRSSSTLWQMLQVTAILRQAVLQMTQMTQREGSPQLLPRH